MVYIKLAGNLKIASCNLQLALNKFDLALLGYPCSWHRPTDILSPLEQGTKKALSLTVEHRHENKSCSACQERMNDRVKE